MNQLQIIPYEEKFALLFRLINEEWISEMFFLEEKDKNVLCDPQKYILNSGGKILFVSSPEHGIVGTCALMKTGSEEFELTKMGVLKKARGLKAGEFLLEAIVKLAEQMSVKNLYLLTNSKCEAAIHLYQKIGFQHDSEIMQLFGKEYARCDTAMRYRKKIF